MHLGYFAQDVEAIAPYLVDEDAMGYKSLDYNAVFVAKIAALEKRIAELEKDKTQLQGLLSVFTRQAEAVATKKKMKNSDAD